MIGCMRTSITKTKPLQRLLLTSNTARQSSTAAAAIEPDHYYGQEGPYGPLLHQPPSLSLLNKHASIRRTFGPRSNAQAMLTCGGRALAKHASFDPSYDRAREWIRRHPVGPAVLSGPVLVGGLIGTLVEASVPQAVYVGSTLRQLQPLIVGVRYFYCWHYLFLHIVFIF